MRYVHRWKYCYESDVRQCFPSINLDILSCMHHDKFRDERFLSALDKTIYSLKDGVTWEDDLVMVYTESGKPYWVRKDKKNCPIGNYPSQWFMNFYLTSLDNFIRHSVKLPHIRFCDNCNVYGDTLDDMHRAEDMIQEFYAKVLNMTLSKSNIRRCQDGVDFVGYRHFPNGKLLVRKSTVKKQRKLLKLLPLEYEAGVITKDQMRSSIDSVLGWWKHAQTYNLKQVSKVYEMRDRYCA